MHIPELMGTSWDLLAFRMSSDAFLLVPWEDAWWEEVWLLVPIWPR